MTTQDTKPRSKRSASQYTYTPEDGLLLEVDDLYVEFRTRDGVATRDQRRRRSSCTRASRSPSSASRGRASP